MKFFGLAIVALQSIALVSGASNKIGDDFPQVQSLAITPESVKKHHTEKYYTDFGFAVRRGLEFELDIAVNIKLDSDHRFLIGIDEKAGAVVPHFNNSIADGPRSSDGDFVYRVKVSSRADDPVGMWQDLAVMVTSSTAAKEGHAKEGHIYEYPFPVFVLYGLDEKRDEMLDRMIVKEGVAEAQKSEMDRMNDGITAQY